MGDATWSEWWSWREAWWPSSDLLVPLEGRRGSGENAGQVGLCAFPACPEWALPACSKHGAMNCVKRADTETGSYWRCLVEGCNIGAELIRDKKKEEQ